MADLDRSFGERRYPNLSRLAWELAKLDPQEEKQMAEEGLGDASWPQT